MSSVPSLGSRAAFTQGPIMRHVIVMATTGSIGLMAIFFVDLLSLLYVSWLGDHALTAAVGYATQVSFFLISISIGFSIAVGALVAQAIGAGDKARAGRLAASSLVHVAVASVVLTLAMLPFRRDLLHLLGARDHVLDVSSTFLLISLPSLPLMSVGMAFAALLRARGDARRAMYVTLGGGLATAVLDPIFIFALGLGVNGAAIVTVLSRLCFLAVGAWGCMRVHRMVSRPQRQALLPDLKIMMRIAIPAILTTLAAPVSTSYALSVFATFGQDVVAAYTIVDRIIGVSFGPLFALSGAVGPIIGQNYGARLFPRIRRTLIDCFTLSSGYSLAVWLILALAAPLIVKLFDASAMTAELIMFYCRFGAIAWVFLGCMFVANAAFNNLGYPVLSMVFNWGRSTLGTIPFVTIGAKLWGPEGAMMGMAAGAALFSLIAIFVAFYVTGRLARVREMG